MTPALHRVMDRNRQPKGAPSSTGGQFSASSRTDAPIRLDGRHVSTTAPREAITSVRDALEEAGIGPVEDPWGRIPDPDWCWTDDASAAVTAAVDALLPDGTDTDLRRLVQERVTVDDEWCNADNSGIGHHVTVTELASSVLWHAAHIGIETNQQAA